LFVLSPLVLFAAACADPQAPEVTPPAVDTAMVHGQFTLEGSDGAVSRHSWSEPEGLVSCRWYAEPERGDYLWIRLAQTPEQDGDAGERLDIDVCRLSQRSVGEFEPMPAGAHGSHCAPDPGFSIWWHAGEDAYNNGPAAGPARSGCALEIEFDAEAMTLTGEFACTDMAAAAHAETDKPASSEVEERGPVSVSAGQFSCHVQRMPTSS
jgi:hypothetical protein